MLYSQAASLLAKSCNNNNNNNNNNHDDKQCAEVRRKLCALHANVVDECAQFLKASKEDDDESNVNSSERAMLAAMCEAILKAAASNECATQSCWRLLEPPSQPSPPPQSVQPSSDESDEGVGEEAADCSSSASSSSSNNAPALSSAECERMLAAIVNLESAQSWLRSATAATAATATAQRPPSLKRKIRTFGLPSELRQAVWLQLVDECLAHSTPATLLDATNALSEARKTLSLFDAQKQHKRNAQRKQQQQAVDCKTHAVISQIDLDVNRTLPEQQLFRAHCEGGVKLRRLLVAYSVHVNSRVAYCQGFNFIAALLLSVFEGNEQNSLKAFVCVVDYIFASKFYFDRYLSGARADQLLLADLLCEQLTKSNDANCCKQRPLSDDDGGDNHATDAATEKEKVASSPKRKQRSAKDNARSTRKLVDAITSSVTLNWFISLFHLAVPTLTRLTILDHFFVEGIRALFRFSLATLALAFNGDGDKLAPLSIDELEFRNAGLVFDKIRNVARCAFDVRKLTKLKNAIELPKNELLAVRRSFYLLECLNANTRQMLIDASIERSVKTLRKQMAKARINESNSNSDDDGGDDSDEDDSSNCEPAAFLCPQVSPLFALSSELKGAQRPTLALHKQQYQRQQPTCSCKRHVASLANSAAKNACSCAAAAAAAAANYNYSLRARRRSSLGEQKSSSSTCCLSAPAKLESSNAKTSSSCANCEHCAKLNSRNDSESLSLANQQRRRRLVSSESGHKVCVQLLSQELQQSAKSQFCILDTWPQQSNSNCSRKLFYSPFLNAVAAANSNTNSSNGTPNTSNFLALGLTNDGQSLICARRAARKSLRVARVDCVIDTQSTQQQQNSAARIQSQHILSPATTFYVHELRNDVVEGFFVERLNLTLLVCANGKLIKLMGSHSSGCVKEVGSISLCQQHQQPQKCCHEAANSQPATTTLRVRLAALNKVTNFVWIYAIETTTTTTTKVLTHTTNNKPTTKIKKLRKKRVRKIILVDIITFDVYSAFALNALDPTNRCKVASIKFIDGKNESAFLLTVERIVGDDNNQEFESDTESEQLNNSLHSRTNYYPQYDNDDDYDDDEVADDNDAKEDCFGSWQQSASSTMQQSTLLSKYNTRLINVQANGRFDCLLSTWNLIDFQLISVQKASITTNQQTKQTTLNLRRRLSNILNLSSNNQHNNTVNAQAQQKQDNNKQQQQQTPKQQITTTTTTAATSSDTILKIVCLFSGNKLSLLEYDTRQDDSLVAFRTRNIRIGTDNNSKLKSTNNRSVGYKEEEEEEGKKEGGQKRDEPQLDDNEDREACFVRILSVVAIDDETNQINKTLDKSNKEQANNEIAKNTCLVTLLTSFNKIVKVLI